MCCFFDLKRKLMLFFCILFSSITLSYGDETVTQIPGTTSSWLAQGFANLMLISTGAQALAVPYATPLGQQQPHLSLNSEYSDGAITGLCYSSCTQKCVPQLMLSNGFINNTTPYCTLPVKQAGVLPSPPPHLQDDALTWCSELSIGEFNAVSDQTSAGTTVHFSIRPNENFPLQTPSLSCQIGTTRTAKDLFTEQLASKKKDNTERKKRQEDSESTTCIPDANNRIYVGQSNITRCLEQNRQSAFFFVENIDFSQLPQAEQNKFPLYSGSYPFSGNLTMPPFSLDNFNMTRNESAAFFHTLANSTINANFSNANLTTTTSISNKVAIITLFMKDHNAIILEIDSAKLQVKNAAWGGRISGIAAQVEHNSYGSIVFKIKERLTITATQGNANNIASIAFGLLNTNKLQYNVTVLGNDIVMMCHGIQVCGGIIGSFVSGGETLTAALSKKAVSFIDVDVNSINITSNVSEHSSYTINGGAIVSGNFPIRNNLFKFRAYINHFIVNGGERSGMIAEIGSVISTIPQQQAMIISNIEVDLTATDINAIGIAYAPNLQQNPTILLLSGNGTLNSPSHLLSGQGSCMGSLIDWSGVSFNTQNVGCSDATLVESITPFGWRTAHHRLAQQICTDDPHACHYVNEVPLALVKGDDNTCFLVSQQTHPYNNTITGQGPIRVTQWTWDDLNTSPQINTHFAINGTQLYSANNQTFPTSVPLSVSSDSTHLSMLFDEDGIKFVSLSLTMNQDTSYHIQTIEGLEGNPVQLVGKDLWIQKENRLNRVTVVPNFKSPSLSIPLGMNNTAVGVAQIKNYIYVAYTMDADGVNTTHVLRFRTDGTFDNTWQATLAEHGDYRYRQLDVRDNETHHVITLPLVTETTHESFEGKTLTVLLPPRGGYGNWNYGETQSTSLLMQRSGNNNLNAAAAASVVILVPIAIAGTLGAKIRYNKSRSKKVQLGEEAAKANKPSEASGSLEAVELTTVVDEVSQAIEADPTGAGGTGTVSESNNTD